MTLHEHWYLDHLIDRISELYHMPVVGEHISPAYRRRYWDAVLERLERHVELLEESARILRSVDTVDTLDGEQ